MQLAGELSKISLSSLMQLVKNGGLTGEISLSQGAKSATIFIDKGRIVHVESDSGNGREALMELFLWLAGSFSFIEGTAGDVPRTISEDEPLDRILKDGITYLEKKRYLDQLRITGQTVLKQTADAVKAQDDPLLQRLDGKLTLGEVLADAKMSRRQYIQSVHRLIVEGLAVVVDPDLPLEDDQVNLPGWVVARLRQDNVDLSQAIVDLVIWVDRVKCWMYQADADLARMIEEFGAGAEGTIIGGESVGETVEEAATPPARPSAASRLRGITKSVIANASEEPEAGNGEAADQVKTPSRPLTSKTVKPASPAKPADVNWPRTSPSRKSGSDAGDGGLT